MLWILTSQDPVWESWSAADPHKAGVLLIYLGRVLLNQNNLGQLFLRSVPAKHPVDKQSYEVDNKFAGLPNGEVGPHTPSWQNKM